MNNPPPFAGLPYIRVSPHTDPGDGQFSMKHASVLLIKNQSIDDSKDDLDFGTMVAMVRGQDNGLLLITTIKGMQK